MNLHKMKTARTALFSAFLSIVVALFLAACNTSGSTATTQGASTSTAISPSSKPTPTVPAKTTPAAAIDPLQAIRMLGTSNGWALTTKNAILKTSDGGRNWQDVTPRALGTGNRVVGEFLTMQTAWLASESGPDRPIAVLRTSDGGASWQAVTINNITGGLVEDTLHFINTQQGWLVTSQAEGMLHYTTNVYGTTDGGQTWKNVSGALRLTAPSGISFSNPQAGWIGLEWPGSGIQIEKTVNGGQSWQQQQLPTPAGVNSTQIGETHTTAPVLIGANGLLPAHINIPNAQLVLYTTHNGGASWTAGAVASFDSSDVYALDTQHVWAEETHHNTMHLSSDGGKTWVQFAQTPQHFDALSFVDIHNGWAIDDAGHLYQTTNGGTSWQTLS